MIGLQEVNRYLSNPVKGISSLEAKRAVERFVSDHNKKKSSSCTYVGGAGRAAEEALQDDLYPLLHAIADQRCSPDILANLLVVLRILLRKERNRLCLSRKNIKAMIDIIREPKSGVILKESFRVVLQMCYEQKNVMAFLELGGVSQLVRFLGRISDEDLQAPLLGAIQSISYQAVGRMAVREDDGIPHIVRFLKSTNEKVRTRAVGALHNLSADPKNINSIRLAGATPQLINMLRSANPDICSAAAGAIQNLSREKLSRALIEDLGAIEPLSELLSSRDVQCQTCAAGALYNVIVPGLEGRPEALKTFKSLMAETIALGVIRGCIEDDEEEEQCNEKLMNDHDFWCT